MLHALEALGVTAQSAEVYQPFQVNPNTSPVIVGYPCGAGKRYVAVLDGPIRGPSALINLLTLLKDASADDEIVVIEQSPGGSVATMALLLDCTLTTKAKTLVVANGDCCSAAAMYLALAPKGEARPFAQIMFHLTSHADQGRSANIVNRALCIIAYADFIYKKVLEKQLLTEDEYRSLVEEKRDFWFIGGEYDKRLKPLRTPALPSNPPDRGDNIRSDGNDPDHIPA